MIAKTMQVLVLGELEVCWQGAGWYRRSQKRPRYYLICALREARPQEATWASRPEDLSLKDGRAA
ncbi:MAG: hypothetical protein ACUVWR_17265 [Anaerolineae bacterium]